MNTALSCLSFRNVSFDVIDRNGQPWLRSPQIAEALGYSQENRITDLYNRNADEFTEAMTALVKLPTKGGAQEVRIFSLRGCHLLGMFARTTPAKEFRKWVLDVLEQHSVQAQPQPQPQNAVLAAQLSELLAGKVLVDYETLGKLARMFLAIQGVINVVVPLIAELEQQCGKPLVQDLMRTPASVETPVEKKPLAKLRTSTT